MTILQLQLCILSFLHYVICNMYSIILSDTLCEGLNFTNLHKQHKVTAQEQKQPLCLDPSQQIINIYSFKT